MMEFDLLFFAWTIPAVIFAGVSKAGFGSGAAFASASILALFLEPAQALGIMLPLLMLVDVAALRPYWMKWSKADAWRLSLGAVPGVLVGVMLYRAANDDVLRLLIGVVSLAFVIYQVAKGRGLIPNPKKAFGPGAGYFTGSVAGFTSFVSHAGGPPVAVYLLAKGLDKTTYQATSVITFWVINLLKSVPYAFLGIFTYETLLADLYLAPFALIGAWIGVWAHRIVPERLFFALTYTMLTLTGSKLIWDALT
ncbi:sulfite exporter TauE/SafE family protein [Algirhabdus cladophorae]|uniref:sulfite exporter TauE/SafE family protein n=1 Tax=Algirhabdus cladophorae TaxID=3377108 RepID=UPI003B8490B1